MKEEILRGKLSSIFELGKQYEDLDWYNSEFSSGTIEEQEDFRKQQYLIVVRYNSIVDEIIKDQTEVIKDLELRLSEAEYAMFGDDL